jgi:uncharacterized membrane protein YfcA
VEAARYSAPHLEVPTHELVLLATLLLATGLVAGLAAGLLGVGGGIVVVPVLFQVFTQLGIDASVRMYCAVGTSLATVIFTAWRSVTTHRRRGAVDVALLRTWVPAVLAGVVAGMAIADAASGPFLGGVFATVALLVAFHMAFGRETWRLADAPPEGVLRPVLGASIGCLSVLMGLGGGTLGVPTLALLGVPIHRAVGTAAGLGLIIGIPGALSFAWLGLGVPGRPPYSLGYVNGFGVALIVPATLVAAPWGVALAHRISQRALRRAFAVFLAVTSFQMFADLI